MDKQATYKLIEDHYRKHSNFLMKALSNASGSKHNAEDAVQEAYTNALQYYKTFDPEKGPFEAWFAPILQNALKKIRREESGRGMTAVAGPADYQDFKEILAEFGKDGVAYDSAVIKEIEEMIGEEREDVAKVLNLALIHQLPYIDIAKLVSQNVNNIQSLVYNFRKKLEARYAS